MYRAVATQLGGCEPQAKTNASSAPRLRIAGRSRLSRQAALRRGALRVRIGPLTQRTKVRLTASPTSSRTPRVAARRATLAPGPGRWVRVPLTGSGRRWLREHRSSRLVLRARTGRGAVSRRVIVR